MPVSRPLARGFALARPARTYLPPHPQTPGARATPPHPPRGPPPPRRSHGFVQDFDASDRSNGGGEGSGEEGQRELEAKSVLGAWQRWQGSKGQGRSRGVVAEEAVQQSRCGKHDKRRNGFEERAALFPGQHEAYGGGE